MYANCMEMYRKCIEMYRKKGRTARHIQRFNGPKNKKSQKEYIFAPPH